MYHEATIFAESFILRFARVLFFLACLLILPATAPAAVRQVQLIEGGAMAGASVYEQNAWGVVKSIIANRTDHAASPLLSVEADKSPGFEFAWRAWVPARSRRTVLSPICPQRISQGARGVNLTTQLIVNADGSEHRLGQATHTQVVPASGKMMTLFVGTAGNDTDERSLLRQLRKADGLGKGYMSIRPRDVPLMPGTMQAVTHMVICAPAADFNPLEENAIRSWVIAGGHLWIMLDRSGAGVGRGVMPHHWHIGVIDRDSLAHIRLTTPGETGGYRATDDYAFDQVRITAPGWNTLSEVRGYPVVLRKRLGRGEVFVTTLQAKAFLRAAEKDSKALASLKLFYHHRVSAMMHPQKTVADALKTYARSRIGYAVMSRVPVEIILLVVVLGIVAMGVVFSRKGRLEIAAIGGAALAVVGAAVLISLGVAWQSRTPTTVSDADWLNLDASGAAGPVMTAAAVYRPQSAAGSDRLHGENGLPDLTSLRTSSAKLVRFTWTDQNHWSAVGLPLTRGAVHTLSLRSTANLQRPARVSLAFSQSDLTGTLSFRSRGTLRDAALVTGDGAIAPVLSPRSARGEVSITVPFSAPLPAGQYFAASVLDASQTARQRIYETLRLTGAFDSQPRLVGWVSPSTTAFPRLTLQGEARDRASLLVSIPVHFKPLLPGTAFRVPAVLIPGTRWRLPHGESNSIYDPLTRQWDKVAHAATAPMAFQLPGVIHRRFIDRFTVHLDISAPDRSVDIITFRGRRAVLLYHTAGLVGSKTITFGRERRPTITDDGKILLGLKVGMDSAHAEAPWVVRRFNVSVEGTAR